METNENKSPEDVFETVLKDLEEKEKAKKTKKAVAIGAAVTGAVVATGVVIGKLVSKNKK